MSESLPSPSKQRRHFTDSSKIVHPETFRFPFKSEFEHELY